MDASGEQLKNQKRLHFKCSDVVARNCDWQVSGNSEREIMPLIEQHSQEKHDLEIDDETLNRVHNAILKRIA